MNGVAVRAGPHRDPSDLREPVPSEVSHVRMFPLAVERSVVLIISMSMLLLWASCKGESSTNSPATSSGKNRPPVITSVKFINTPISLTGPVAVQIEAEDPEREAVSFQYQWYVNNAPLAGQTSATLPPELLRRGQTVSVEVVPLDTNKQKGPLYRTVAASVGNTPPIVTRVSLVSQAIQTGERLEAQVEATDPDHDRVELTYRWFKNNAAVKEGEESFLDITGFVARDAVVVEVTAHDPSAAGDPVRSNSLILGNSLPKIVSTPPVPGPSDHFEYTVKAVDSDGDVLTYHLETAPPGMTIDEQSGHIAWSVPSNQQGPFRVKVFVKDSQGGAAYQEFDLTFSAPAFVKPAGA